MVEVLEPSMLQVSEGVSAPTGLHAQGHHLSPREASSEWLLPDAVESVP